MKATINERGNGLPDVGDYVPGTDGELYRVVSVGSIQVGRSPGCGDWLTAEIDLADWDDCSEEDEFPAQAVIEDPDEAEEDRQADAQQQLDDERREEDERRADEES
jgi:hypothetical protein